MEIRIEHEEKEAENPKKEGQEQILTSSKEKLFEIQRI